MSCCDVSHGSLERRSFHRLSRFEEEFRKAGVANAEEIAFRYSAQSRELEALKKRGRLMALLWAIQLVPVCSSLVLSQNLRTKKRLVSITRCQGMYARIDGVEQGDWA